MNYPYSDNDMVYEHSRHRYKLTEECVRREIGIDLATMLNSRGVVDRAMLVSNFLRQISDVIYNYIYSCNTENALQEYLAAKHPAARPILKEAMLQQVMYVTMNGDLTKVSGVDIRKGSAMPRQALVAATIDSIAKTALERELDIKTPALTYRGSSFRYWGFKRLPAYESEGY